MKPIYMEMSAFGPFSDITEVDFSKIGRNGIFLVTGDTGAGKTTIFDALSFALYGEASGGKERRISKNFRSDYALASSKTYVILRFEHQGRIYRIERGPTYTRAAKRGSGTTEEAAYVNFYCEDEPENVCTRIDEADKKISEIIGLDRKQFSQTVMIAQGDFMKILNEKSADRKEIFQRIFNTSVFNRFQEKLKERESICRRKLDNINSETEIEMSHAHFADDCDDILELKSVETLAQFTEKLSEKNKGYKSELKKAEKEIKTLSKETEKTTAELTEGRKLNELIDEYADKCRVFSELTKRKEEFEIKQKQLSSAQAAQNILPDESLLISCENRLAEKKKAATRLENAEKSLKEMLDTAKKKLEAAEKENKNIDVLKQKIIEIENNLPFYDKLEKYEKKYKTASKKLLELKEKSTKAENEYRKQLDVFILGQAGILAENLIDGEPCSVCGSTVHPNPAKKIDGVPTQEEVNEAESKSSKLKTEYTEFGKEVSALNEKIASLTSRIAGEFTSSSQAQKHYDELKNKVSTIEKAFESANKAYNEANVKYAENTAEIKTVISDIESLENEKVRLSKKFSELITQYGFKNNEEYQASKADDEKIYNLSEEINNYKTELSVIASRRNELSAQLENTEKCDISALEIKKKQLSDEYSKKDKERVKLFGICEQNNKVIKKLEKLADERNRLREEWAVISDLSKTANGNQGSGKAKFSLETYIQQYYFKQVIASANKRLTLLTDGMFVLRCKDKAKNLKQQVGLDLDVLDRSTGQWRDVSTLSGGESFLASISLALGLSDIVQSGNGGIQLDSMFIDEGFGTLDDNALSQAIALLDKLSDGKRLIGIISHVTELKNRIDKKIIVSKEAMGSRLKIEI